MKIAYVFLNGELLGNPIFYQEKIKNHDIYAADGGANLLDKLNLFPLELWGDLDSINQKLLEKYMDNNVIIKKFPKEKDFTDGEIIIDYVSKKDYDKIIVIGALGGRKDHELSNINLLFKFPKISFLTETETIINIDKNHEIQNVLGKTISFIPMSDEVTDLNLVGFKYPLTNYHLTRGESICMSNVAIEKDIKISFTSGKLIGIIIN